MTDDNDRYTNLSMHQKEILDSLDDKIKDVILIIADAAKYELMHLEYPTENDLRAVYHSLLVSFIAKITKTSISSIEGLIRESGTRKNLR